MEDRPHALYRFYDKDDQLLYVGITIDPGTRWGQHAKDKTWWTEVVRTTIEQFPTRADVLMAERVAIQTENPKYNIMHKGGASMANVKGTEIPTKSKYVMIYDGNKYAARYGNCFWCVEYGDGEWVTLYADRYEINTGGVLTFWAVPKQVKAEDPFDDAPHEHKIEMYEDKPNEAERSLMSFAPGGWTRVYAASVWDGSAPVVDRWRELAS